jgi:hypothetical protein
MTVITALPTAPTRTDPATFSARADAWDAALVVFGPQVNAVASETNAAAAAAAASAVTAATQVGLATTQATDAATSASTAAASANNKGAWSALSGALNMPASVTHAGKVWILTANLGNVATATPGVSGSWFDYATLFSGGLMPVGGMISLPTTSADLVTGPLGEKYLRSGVVDDAATYPLAPSELVPSIVSPLGGTWPWASGAQDDLVFGNGLFVRSHLNSSTNQPIWSTDGINWTSGSGATMSGSNAHSIAFDSATSTFYHVAGDGTAMYVNYSTDGKTWFNRSTIAAAYTLRGMAVNNGNILVSVTANSIVLTSNDSGFSFTARGTNFTVGCSASPPAFGAGLFVVQGAGQATSATSTNGVTWTQRTLGFSAMASPECPFVNGKFWTATASQLYSSTDGFTWSAVTVASFSTPTGRFAITFTSGVFMLLSGRRAWTSTDGTTWTARTSPFDYAAADPISCATTGTLMIVGDANTAGNYGPPARSADGITWNTYGPTRCISFSANPIITSDTTGRLLAMNANNYTTNTSTNGLLWTPQVTTAFAGGSYQAMVSNGVCMAMDLNAASVNFYTSTDGGLNYALRTITSSGGGTSYTCAAFGSGGHILLPGNLGTVTQAWTSPTGVTWTSRTVPGGNYVSVNYSASLGKFFALDATGAVITCTGAATNTWTSATGTGMTCALNTSGILCVSSNLLAWSQSHKYYKYSTDSGVTWITKAVPSNTAPAMAILSGDGKVYMMTDAIHSSTDGVTWTYVCQVPQGFTPRLFATATGFLLAFAQNNTFTVEYRRVARVANSIALYPVRATGGTASLTQQMYMRVA